MAKKPHLTPVHTATCLAWTEEHQTWDDQWVTAIFSDEKKWNLDGPDGCASYWHDLRKEPRSFFSRQQGGRAVMVWGGFSFNGCTELSFLTGRQKVSDYVRVLNDYLLPSAEGLAGPNFVFQQDNAAIHTAGSTRKWFETRGITVMKWPAKSPDLNLWGILTRAVYANNRQFSSVNELKMQIIKSWYDVRPEIHQDL